MPWVLAKGDTVDTRCYIPIVYGSKEEALNDSFNRYSGYYPEAGTREEIAQEWAAFAAYQLGKMKVKRRW